MRWTLIHIISRMWMFAAVFAAAGCDVHQFPGDEPVNPTVIHTTLKLHACPQMQNYYPESVYGPEVTEPLSPQESLKARYLLEIYEDESFSHERIYSERFTLDRIQIPQTIERELILHAFRYKVVLWQDLVPEQSPEEDYWYLIPQLTSIKVWDADRYRAQSDSKLAQSCTETFDLREYEGKWHVERDVEFTLQRPQAKFILIANDVEKFIRTYGSEQMLLDSRIRVSYTGFLPVGYNAYTGLLNDSRPGYSFEGVIYPLNTKQAVVAFDYVLLGTVDTSVDVRVDVYDSHGTLLNTGNVIRVPLSRNRCTIIEKDFLTREYGGGVGLETDFDGEYNIYY